MFSKGKATFSVVALVLSLLATGCGVGGINRADARAVGDAFFRAIMAKDYQKVQDAMGSGGSIPSKQAWNDGSFIAQIKPGFKELWLKGPISGYTTDEIVFNDLTPPAAKKLVLVSFILDGRKGAVAFSMERQGNEWYPVWSRWFSLGIMVDGGLTDPLGTTLILGRLE